jgi:hypothetical protein
MICRGWKCFCSKYPPYILKIRYKMRISWYTCKDLGESTNYRRVIIDIRIDWCSKCTKYPNKSSRISARALHVVCSLPPHIKYIRIYKMVFEFSKIFKDFQRFSTHFLLIGCSGYSVFGLSKLLGTSIVPCVPFYASNFCNCG